MGRRAVSDQAVRKKMKLVVLSDLHLLAPDDRASGPDNHGRLEAAIDRINTAYGDADLVVFAGDLVDRGKHLQPYEDFRAALFRLTPRHAVTIGNHDLRDNFLEVFDDAHCYSDGFVQSVHDADGYRVIILDSVSSEPAPAHFRGARASHGQLCAMRLAWLDAQLEDAEGIPVIVILHHPPLQLSITSDQMALREPEALISRLAAHGGVRHVISGHIHMTTTSFHRGIPFTTIAGGASTTREDFGRIKNKHRKEGPAQMAVILADETQVTVHFDNYVDANLTVEGYAP